jgi:hypothetical protein
MIVKNLLGLCLIICFINISQITCLNDDEDSTTASTSFTNPTTSTTIEPNTTTVTTSTVTIITTTTNEPTTTTPVPATTTTTTPAPDQTFNFTIYYNNNSTQACLRVKFAAAFDIQYETVNNENATARVKLEKPESFQGACSDSLNTLTLMFNTNWALTLNYTLKNKNEYSLDIIDLTYVPNAEQFPNISSSDVGKPVTVSGTNLDEFSASKGNSYKCSAKTKVDLGKGVQVEFTNYQGQPFISPDSKSTDFDTAIECSADTAGTSKLVPIIVGSTLALLVVLVLVAYVVGRHKHKTGYQQV